MPIYEYVCNSCGQGFEKLVMGGDDVCCPKCESRDLRRSMSTFSHKGTDSGFSSSQGSSCSGCSSTSCSSCH